MVYWNSQDVVCALIGGVFIAISTSLNLLLYGRITGLSGIFNTVIKYDKSSGFDYKACYCVGLITIPAILYQIFNCEIITDHFSFVLFDQDNSLQQKQGVAAWIIGGLLVGWGTRMGNGCTSGHGVCGMPRFAPRSIVATMTFMATGFGIATLRYYYPFLTGGDSFGDNYANVWRWISLAILILGNCYAVFLCVISKGKRLDLSLSWMFGLLFGFGLVLSGMCRVSKIQNFLIIGSVWDPSLIFVMMSAVAINVLTFNYILRKTDKPLLAGSDGKYCVPPRGVVDLRLVLGAAIFGLGWGIAGLCPGPGMIIFFSMTHGILFLASLAIGQIAFDLSLNYWQQIKQNQVDTKDKEIKSTYSEMNEDIPQQA